MILAVAAMIFLKNTDYRRLQSAGVAFTAIGVMIILLAIVYFFDPAQHRWLRAGPIGVAAVGTGEAGAGHLSGLLRDAAGARHQFAATRCCRRRWRWG